MWISSAEPGVPYNRTSILTSKQQKEEELDWKENKDPITLFSAYLAKEGIATNEELEAMQAKIKADADAAVEYALSAKYPDASEVDMHVFTDVAHALA